MPKIARRKRFFKRKKRCLQDEMESKRKRRGLDTSAEIKGNQHVPESAVLAHTSSQSHKLQFAGTLSLLSVNLDHCYCQSGDSVELQRAQSEQDSEDGDELTPRFSQILNVIFLDTSDTECTHQSIEESLPLFNASNDSFSIENNSLGVSTLQPSGIPNATVSHVFNELQETIPQTPGECLPVSSLEAENSTVNPCSIEAHSPVCCKPGFTSTPRIICVRTMEQPDTEVEAFESNITDPDELFTTVRTNLLLMLPQQWVPVLKADGVHIGMMATHQHLIIQRSVFISWQGDVLAAFHGTSLPEAHVFYSNLVKVPLSIENIGEFSDNAVAISKRMRSLVTCQGVEKFECQWRHAPNSCVDFNTFHEEMYSRTCRSKDCYFLVEGSKLKRCNACVHLLEWLRKRSRTKTEGSPQTPSSKKPHASLSPPEVLCRLQRNSKEKRNLRDQINRLRKKIDLLVKKKGVD